MLVVGFLVTKGQRQSLLLLARGVYCCRKKIGENFLLALDFFLLSVFQNAEYFKIQNAGRSSDVGLYRRVGSRSGNNYLLIF